MFFDTSLKTRLRSSEMELIEKAINQNPELFESKSTFIRGCIVRRLRILFPKEMEEKNKEGVHGNKII